MHFIKPAKLQKGDTVAIVSPSWGGPWKFPRIYKSGLKALENLGLKIKEFPSARRSIDFLYNNPEFRAKDINDAFANKSVKAIISSIGGDDCVRILPFLNSEIIKNNPKIFMGYSDTSVLTTYLNQLGLVTFNGPAVMAGFSQWNSLEEKYQKHIAEFLFEDFKGKEYPTFDFYANGYPDFDDKNTVGKTKALLKNDGWHCLQGNSKVSGILWGGCIEALEFFKGTSFWPKEDFWNDKILFFETSEEKTPIEHVKWMLRNYGMQGIFDKVSAILFGRARDYSELEKEELDKAIVQVIKGEFKNDKIIVVTNMDFGHTDPQIILPLGVNAEVDPVNKTFKLLESQFK